MTTMTYEERLLAFAEGKRLGQLAKAVRDVDDGVRGASCAICTRSAGGLASSGD